MDFIDRESLYGNQYNACALCEYTRELALIKRLIDIADEAVDAQVVTDGWSFNGVCHSFAKTVIEYSKAAYDNVLLGNFHAVNMICRAILENCVFLEILIDHAEVELWKYYLVYSLRSTIFKAGRTPTQRDIDNLQEMYQHFEIDEDFYIKQSDRKKAYIREPYGWTYKINTKQQFNFEGICKLIDYEPGHHGFQMMSDYSHGTSFHMKMHSSVFVGDMMTMFVNLYIELYRMVTLYCWDTADDRFDEISEEIEYIFQRFIEYEETHYDY
jgi:hypothetical protein